MVYVGTNTTGWTQLMNGNMISAAYHLYDTAFLHYFIFIIFLIFQAMLWYKTKSATLTWVTGLFFASLYATATFVETVSIQWIFILLVVQLAGILYMWLLK